MEKFKNDMQAALDAMIQMKLSYDLDYCTMFFEEHPPKDLAFALLENSATRDEFRNRFNIEKEYENRTELELVLLFG